jgi:Mg2+-importing ATPase
MMSVVVESDAEGIQLLCKGAPEAVFAQCSTFDLNGEILPMDPLLIEDLKEEYRSLSADGFRVLAVATKKLDRRPAYSKEDEKDLVLKGYVAFLDPPKETAKSAIAALQSHGVTVKVLTGDNDLVTKKICGEVGLATDRILLGTQIESMSEVELEKAVEQVHVFARLSPLHKRRVVLALQKNGHVVGFMGDGINDAPGLRAADVGISVDTAVDIAKESADDILLEKSLMVLEEGVLEGRKVFANIVKYVRMGASSNFGNMFSVLGASALFPFVPMRPIQILTNNLLYDFSQVPIPTDDVDPELVTRPRPWQIDEIKRFILFIGPISSIFDYTTYFIMWIVFRCSLLERLLPPPGTPESLLHQLNPAHGANYTYAAALFRTGWFVESLMTQTLIIHVIRTNRIPFIQSRASWPLIVTTVLIMTIGVLLPMSPLGGYLGFAPLPALYWPLLCLTLLAYMLLTQLTKWWLLKKAWI